MVEERTMLPHEIGHSQCRRKYYLFNCCSNLTSNMQPYAETPSLFCLRTDFSLICTFRYYNVDFKFYLQAWTQAGPLTTLFSKLQKSDRQVIPAPHVARPHAVNIPDTFILKIIK